VANFCILHFDKIDKMASVAGRGKHNERTRDTPNADPARAHLNEQLVGSGDTYADVQGRIDAAGIKRKIRDGQHRAVEYMVSASPGHFDPADRETVRAWAERSIDWARQRHGAENVVSAHLHMDEKTPHLHIMVVPITPDNRLSAKDYFNGKAKLREMHDSYHAAVAAFGLERGERGSKRQHVPMQQLYARTEVAQAQARETVAARVEIEQPTRIIMDPARYKAEQEARVREQIIAPLSEAAVCARLAEERARRAEAILAAAQGQVAELRKDNKTMREEYGRLIAQVKGIDLADVMRALGGQQDRYDKKLWRVNGEHISVNPARNGGAAVFYNHDREKGGQGPIDLVMHVTGYDFRQAVAYLAQEGGRDLAVAAAAQFGAHQGEVIASRVERGVERAPLKMPERAEELWPQVRAYLTRERAIPAPLVDRLHAEGTVYAARHVDATGQAHTNAVFVRQDAQGEAVGANWRGTDPGSTLTGLATGTRREAGHFSYRVGEPAPYTVPQYIITESAIDAMSRHALLVAERRGPLAGEYVFVSTDGHGALPTRQIAEGLAMGALVRCAFDNDEDGEKLWAKVREAYPDAGAIERDRPAAGVKDWNQALQQQRECGQEQTPERARARESRADERR